METKIAEINSFLDSSKCLLRSLEKSQNHKTARSKTLKGIDEKTTKVQNKSFEENITPSIDESASQASIEQ